jgi:hypothetical protein
MDLIYVAHSKGPFQNLFAWVDRYWARFLKRSHDESLDRMATVDAIYAALESQITDPEAHAAAIVRTTEKRKNHVPAK